MPRGRADFRNHGAAHERSRRPPAGYPLLGRGAYVAAERNDPDVLADERLPFAALAESNLQSTKRRPPALAALACVRASAVLPCSVRAAASMTRMPRPLSGSAIFS